MKDGGPAFPRAAFSGGEFDSPSQEGMSLRDYFAGQALIGMFASGGHVRVAGEIAKTPEAFCMDPVGIGHVAEQQIASMAYAMADAMIKARDAAIAKAEDRS